MKIRNLKYFVATLCVIVQPLSSYAAVVVSPVDKNPTSIKGSRATYGQEVDGTSRNASYGNTAASDNERTVLHTTRSSVSMPEQSAETTDSTLLDSSYGQQAQMEPSSGFGWFWALFALVAAGLVYYVVQRKDPYAKTHGRGR